MRQEWLIIGKTRVYIFDMKDHYDVHDTMFGYMSIARNKDKSKAITEALRRVNENYRKYSQKK